MQDKTEEIYLSMENLCCGGSLTLFSNEACGELRILDEWVGTEEMSAAEGILARLPDLLNRAGVLKTEIGAVVFGDAPVRSTGYRTGRAIAEGLAKAFGGDLRSVSVNAALAGGASFEGQILTVVQVGKNQIYRQEFENNFNAELKPADSGRLGHFADLDELLNIEVFDQIILSEQLFRAIKADRKNSPSIYNAGNNLSRIIGRYAVRLKCV